MVILIIKNYYFLISAGARRGQSKYLAGKYERLKKNGF